MAEKEHSVVVDDGRARLSDLWKKEDYWAIWLGFVLLIAASLSTDLVTNMPRSSRNPTRS